MSSTLASLVSGVFIYCTYSLVKLTTSDLILLQLANFSQYLGYVGGWMDGWMGG